MTGILKESCKTLRESRFDLLLVIMHRRFLLDFGGILSKKFDHTISVLILFIGIPVDIPCAEIQHL